ncbi:MAG: hypothetical protein GEU93_01550 [Propionibacteriales bacterium]|nr:hypothetical protein [Propionibacteriales bacterium]
MMKKLLLVAVATVTAFTLTVPPASADAGGVKDGNDVAGRLDLKRVSQHHDGNWVIHRWATYRGWSKSILRRNTGNRFVMWGDSNIYSPDTGVIFRKDGRWRCRNSNGAFWCVDQNIFVRHPSRRVLTMKWNPPSGMNWIVWRGGTRFFNDGACSSGCRDWAPRRGAVLFHEF